MRVLIVESEHELANIWRRHLERLGMTVARACCQDDAIAYLSTHKTDVLVMNLVLEEGSALSVADYASYRIPDARIIFVTNTTFFSDGSIFAFAPNACAFVPTTTPVDDIAALVEHYGTQDAPETPGLVQ